MLRRMNKKGDVFLPYLVISAVLVLMVVLISHVVTTSEKIEDKCERVALENLDEPFVCTVSNPEYKEYVCTCWQELSYGEMMVRDNYVSFYITKP